ncbi:MAG: PEP-CTERM sorting domain-containing protein [Chthoniobacterales bacterium]
MKNTILSLLVAVGLIGSASAQTTLFQDDFSGTSVDATKWDVTNLGGGYITQGGGVLNFNHPNFWDGVFITTKADFTTPYKIVGSFLPDPDYPITAITLRASGAYGGYYNDPYGITVGFFGGTSVSVYYQTPVIYQSLVNVDTSFNVNSNNTFSIYDYGDSISLLLNDNLIIDRVAASPTISYGNKVVFTDSDNGNFSGLIDKSSIGPVTITSVPEPSTYALFGIGAIALIVTYRRKVA